MRLLLTRPRCSSISQESTFGPHAHRNLGLLLWRGCGPGCSIRDHFKLMVSVVEPPASAPVAKDGDAEDGDDDLVFEEEGGGKLTTSRSTRVQMHWDQQPKFCIFKVLHSHPALLKRVKGCLSRGFSSTDIAVSVYQPLHVDWENRRLHVSHTPHEGSVASAREGMAVISKSLFSSNLFHF